jgi:hypothetical protein
MGGKKFKNRYTYWVFINISQTRELYKFRESVSYINATGLRNFGPGITAQKRRLRNYLFRKTDN